MPQSATDRDAIFTYGTPQLKFGPGASAEIGYDLTAYDVGRVLLVTDPGVAETGAPARIAEHIAAYGFDVEVYADSHVEPTDISLGAAVEAARTSGPWDAYVAVGGGSSIDTAKAINLMLNNPGELLDYVNPPVGGGRKPESALSPLVAVPMTTGTGSESTSICVLDVVDQQVKSGISHPRLRPTLAIVDPDLTRTQPPGVTAASGMDILCHAVESYTARSYDSYPAKAAFERVPYCGANPISDMWSEKAMSLLATSLRAAVRDGADSQARTAMAMAATFAGIGFGNAGVHIPHANAYPIAGRVRTFRPADYPGEEPLVPHGMAVALTAPEALRFTFPAQPQRHLRAAALLAPDAPETKNPADLLPSVLIDLMRDIGIPSGIGAVGYGESDIDMLVEGTLKQQRLLTTSPRDADAEDLAGILRASIELW